MRDTHGTCHTDRRTDRSAHRTPGNLPPPVTGGVINKLTALFQGITAHIVLYDIFQIQDLLAPESFGALDMIRQSVKMFKNPWNPFSHIRG